MGSILIWSDIVGSRSGRWKCRCLGTFKAAHQHWLDIILPPLSEQTSRARSFSHQLTALMRLPAREPEL